MKIYSITNVETRKVYIGSSCQYERRVKDHKTLLKHNKHHNCHLQNSWNKYGEDNFVFSVIQDLPSGATKEDLLLREKYWIEKFKACDRSYGYNLTEDPSSPGSKKVLQVNTSDYSVVCIFNNWSAAAVSVNSKSKEIQDVCYTVSKSSQQKKNVYRAKGYHWCFEEDYDPERFKELEQQKRTNNKIKTVYKFNRKGELVGTYPTIKAAALDVVGATFRRRKNTIGDRCRGVSSKNCKSLWYKDHIYQFDKHFDPKHLIPVNRKKKILPSLKQNHKYEKSL